MKCSVSHLLNTLSIIRLQTLAALAEFEFVGTGGKACASKPLQSPSSAKAEKAARSLDTAQPSHHEAGNHKLISTRKHFRKTLQKAQEGQSKRSASQSQPHAPSSSVPKDQAASAKGRPAGNCGSQQIGLDNLLGRIASENWVINGLPALEEPTPEEIEDLLLDFLDPK